MNQIKKIFKNIDPFSLRVRLTIGVAAVSALGLSSLAIWTSWKMEEILIESHKHSIEQIATRLPVYVQLDREITPSETGLQRPINNLTTTNTLLWIKNSENKILAKSTIGNLLSDSTATKLMSLADMPTKPQVYKINQRYFLLYSDTLFVQGKMLGNLYVVQDITYEQRMFQTILRSLSIASILTITIISVAIAFYIKYSLQPLRQLSQMTEVISAEDLPEAHLYLHNAPSEVKELTQTFNMMLSRLSQSWEQERQFVSNVSHELRTPLTIVHGYLQSVLRRQNNLTEIQREALETAASEAERTIRLLQDLLDLARADSGYLHFRIEPCVVNDLVAEVVTMAEKYTQRRITIESENGSIEVKADYNRLKQVLINLIDNAVKYSQPDTTVIVKLYQQEESAIIQIRDKGYGIPLQHQARIFERFYRVDEARTSSTGGCGLGLSIVKTLVEGMDGSVTVRSRLSEGSVFTITLPAYRLPE
ncbi:HAMP domain-containing protein [Scytonema hofmannii FACHB-248]|uniref:histidine kinase n=1 Tax=Scytonema hofmannii FACHB-248 TaxID=1842502 RepID=A0ABR8GYH6_9CYAN|nr:MULTISPECIES: ATP-binding protein [Nostocales]MBD2608478.1 HAMP domain-containing protein [Scytonema hofmannii FACHB-248]